MRILYAGDWTGTMQIFATVPGRDGPIGQLTFDHPGSCYSPTACGFSRPLRLGFQLRKAVSLQLARD